MIKNGPFTRLRHALHRRVNTLPPAGQARHLPRGQRGSSLDPRPSSLPPRRIRPMTMVEILTVMAILAVLMGMGLGVFSFAYRRMSDAQTEALIKKLEVALENYKSKVGYYLQQHQAAAFYLDTQTADFRKYSGLDYEKMMRSNVKVYENSGDSYHNKSYIVDPYDNPIIYRCPGKKNRTSFDLISMGSDGKPGKEDYDDNSSGAKDGTGTPWNWEDAVEESGQNDNDDITNF